MAGISVGQDKQGKRALVHDVPLLPFIDFMVCLIAFLMVTAVWTRLSRIESTARVPGGELSPVVETPKELHVLASSGGFDLRWQRGPTVIETRHVARVPVQVSGEARFPALSDAISHEWNAQGEHRSPTDQRLDRAVLHVQNDLPFSEVVAVLDALHAPRRGRSSAFDVSFSSN